MTASSMKKILNSFVEPSHRNFELCFGSGKPRKMVASYLRQRRRVTIVTEYFDDPFDMVGAAMHELAHHLTWEFDAASFTSARSQKKRLPHHGKEFRKHLSRLIRNFFVRYREQVQGVLAYNPRKPARSPRFVTFETIQRYGINLQRGPCARLKLKPAVIFKTRSAARSGTRGTYRLCSLEN